MLILRRDYLESVLVLILLVWNKLAEVISLTKVVLHSLDGG